MNGVWGKLWEENVPISHLPRAQKLVVLCSHDRRVTSNSGVRFESHCMKRGSRRVKIVLENPPDKVPVKYSTTLSLEKFPSASFPPSVGTDRIFYFAAEPQVKLLACTLGHSI